MSAIIVCASKQSVTTKSRCYITAWNRLFSRWKEQRGRREREKERLYVQARCRYTVYGYVTTIADLCTRTEVKSGEDERSHRIGSAWQKISSPLSLRLPRNNIRNNAARTYSRLLSYSFFRLHS